MNERKDFKKGILTSAKEIARIAVFVALAIAAQYLLSAVPSVEVITLLFSAFAFVYGAARGAIAGVAFSLLRQFLFGFFPTVLVLYLVYYPLLSLCFGLLGRWTKKTDWKTALIASALACVCTVAFTMIDNLITPLFSGYSERARGLYFAASLPFMGRQLICVAISVGGLFFPLTKAFFLLKK